MKPWDQSDYAEFKDMHTVVTMVQKDAHGKDTNKKEILQGSVAEIFSTKVNGRTASSNPHFGPRWTREDHGCC